MEIVADDSEVDQFILKFYTLEGVSLKEKQKAFNLLLLTIPPHVDTLLPLLNPRNCLEKLFKLKILLKFQKIPLLIQVLQAGEEYLSFQIIQDKTFCQNLAASLEKNVGSFVDDVIPCLSYVLRLRLLDKLAIYGNNLDCLFENICNRYGVHIAANMIVGCSESKINEIFEYNKVTLSLSHLKVLYKKSRSTFESYLKQNHGDTEAILNYVAQEDINYFWEIIKTYNVPKVGKRITRKLIKVAKSDVIMNASRYKFLHLKTVVKTLGAEFDKYYFNCFPPKFESLNYHFVCDHNFVKILGARRYYVLLKKGIEEIYNKSIYDVPDVFTDEILQTLSLKERDEWILTKKKSGTAIEDLVKYFIVKDSIPLIKQEINVTSSISHREKLLRTLIDTCKFHNDLNALNEVLLYISNRHRNDEALVDILCHIDYTYELKKLRSSHWNVIKKIADIITARGNTVYNKENRSLQYIEFLFNEKALTDKDIFEHLKIVKSNHCWDKQPENPELKKLIILKYVEFMPQLLDKDDQTVFCDLEVLNRIVNWNKENPKDKLNIFGNSRLLNSFYTAIDLAIKDEAYEPKLMLINNIIEYYLMHEGFDKEFSDTMIGNYFLFGSRYYNLNIDLHLLKHRPDLILKSCNKFCEHLLASYHPDLQILSYVKKYSYLLLPDKVVSFCQQILETSENKQQKLFLILAVLLPVQEFINTASTFYPTSNNCEGSNAQQEWAIHVAGSFKYTTSAAALPGLIKFCKGDYLRYSLESLYYLFYHLPENHLDQFLGELSSKAVSVRKHSIFLTCITSGIYNVQKLFSTFNENEKNVSMQKHLFSATLKYFVRNPSDDFWEAVKTCVKKLDQKDSESISLLTNLSLIPAKYQVRHVTFVWDILQAKHKSRLLTRIPATLFEDLSSDFICEVICGQFLNENAVIAENDINNFVITAIYKRKCFIEILNLVFIILTRFIQRASKSLESQKKVNFAHCLLINSFFDASATDDANHEIVKEFSDRWHTRFNVKDYLEEHLKLSLLVRFFNVGKDLEKFSAEVADIYNDIYTTYGIIVIDIFASVLQNCLSQFVSSEIDTEYFVFCLTLMKNFPKLEIYFLIIKLLPNWEPVEDKTKEVFYNVLNVLHELTDESVQLLLRIYLNKLN